MSGPKAQDSAGGDRPANDEQGPRHPDVDYIASMLEGLRKLAVGAERPFLAYLIGVAIEEAKDERGSSN